MSTSTGEPVASTVAAAEYEVVADDFVSEDFFDSDNDEADQFVPPPADTRLEPEDLVINADTLMSMIGGDCSDPTKKSYWIQLVVECEFATKGLTRVRANVLDRIMALKGMSDKEFDTLKIVRKSEYLTYLKVPHDDTAEFVAEGNPTEAPSLEEIKATKKERSRMKAINAGYVETALVMFDAGVGAIEFAVNSYTQHQYNANLIEGFQKYHQEMSRREAYKHVLLQIARDDPEFLPSLLGDPKTTLFAMFAIQSVGFCAHAKLKYNEPQKGKSPMPATEEDSSSS